MSQFLYSENTGLKWVPVISYTGVFIKTCSENMEQI